MRRIINRHAKLECNDEIKPQGIMSKIIAPNSYELPNPNANPEFSAPAESLAPENEDGNVDDADVHPDRVS